jgi:hypothetical protein
VGISNFREWHSRTLQNERDRKDRLSLKSRTASGDARASPNPYPGFSGSTGFCGHVFSGAYELKNDLGSASGKSFEDISVIPEPENSQIVS